MASKPPACQIVSASGQPERASRSSISCHSVISKPGWAGAEPPRQLADHVMVGPALGVGLEQLARDLDAGVAGRLVDVVVLEEHGRRQHDVGHLRGLGHELLVHADEQVVAREALVHLVELRRDAHRVGVLDQQRRDRRAVAEVLAVADQDRPDPRLIEHADRRVEHIEPFDDGLVPVVQVALIVERAAALVLPGAGHDRQAGRRVHVGGAVARAREAEAEPQVGAPGRAVEAGEVLDLGDRQPGDARRPFRRAGRAGALPARASRRRSGPDRRDRHSRRGTARASPRRRARRRCRAAAPDARPPAPRCRSGRGRPRPAWRRAPFSRARRGS